MSGKHLLISDNVYYSDPKGLLFLGPPGTSILADHGYTQPPINTVGQLVAGGKIIIGVVFTTVGLKLLLPAAAVGLISETGVVFFVNGSVLFSDGFASAIAEVMGGDTGSVPSTDILIWFDITSKVANSYCGDQSKE